MNEANQEILVECSEFSARLAKAGYTTANLKLTLFGNYLKIVEDPLKELLEKAKQNSGTENTSKNKETILPNSSFRG